MEMVVFLRARKLISKLIFAPARKRPFPFWTKQTCFLQARKMATRTCTTIRVQRSAIQLSGPVKREVPEQDLASVISTYTTSSWMAICYCQPAYCLQTGNGRISAYAKINLLTCHLNSLYTDVYMLSSNFCTSSISTAISQSVVCMQHRKAGKESENEASKIA